MLPSATTYADLCARFEWAIPARYNIGWDVCDKWARCDPARVALILDEEGRDVSFEELRGLSNRMANLLADLGVARGDRVAVLLPQRLETAVAHIGALKLGAISIPLFTLFGEDALAHRLADSGAKVVVTDTGGAAKLAKMRDSLPDLAHVLNADNGLDAALAGQSDGFTNVDTAASDPAFIIYTSGTTGNPKGALLPHSTLLGHLPGVEMFTDLMPQPDDRMWTPADWAWIGGLLNVLLTTLHHGVPVIARRFPKFSGEAAFDLMARQRVRTAFIPPTALKMMRRVNDPPKVAPRAIGSGGESLGVELLDWGRKTLGVTINEFYGQTECNLVVASCTRIGLHKPGAMGRATPGFDVCVLDDNGAPVTGQEGRIAVRAPNPVMFLRYWNNEAATREKVRNGWLIMGDRGIQHDDGAFSFVGRDDDVITSSGYRIGPGEIEDCLIKHDAVAMAGVVGKPDTLRGEIVAAYIVLREGVEGSDALAAEIADFVKTRLAAHEYPREITFLDALPLTTTGKIIRRVLRGRASSSRTIP